MNDIKARIEITEDEHGNVLVRSNIVPREQQRELLHKAIKSIGSPLVLVGGFSGKTKPDFRRPIA